MSKIKIIPEKCLGCGTCVALAANTFELNAENKSTIKNPAGDSEAAILDAAKACPTEAIEIEDKNGKKLWPEG